jgi:hypothetical protein
MFHQTTKAVNASLQEVVFVVCLILIVNCSFFEQSEKIKESRRDEVMTVRPHTSSPELFYRFQ